MSIQSEIKIDPKLDLVLEREIDISPEAAWAGWTQPNLLKQWFCPKPWGVSDCRIELRPGGAFHTVMRSPEGQEFPSVGCYLEVVPNRKLVWTSALLPGFRPADAPVSEQDLRFTGILLLEPSGKGTKYKAIAAHGNEAACKQHEQMGFQVGWGIALDQLVALMKEQAR